MNYLNKYKIHFIVLLAFTFITFFYFPSLFLKFSTLIETNDGRLVAWIISWDIHKILTDPLNIFQANTFFPNQNTLAYTEHFIGTSFLGMPVWLYSGGNPSATFNFIMISGYVLNAYFTFLLIRKLVKDNGVAFLGAFINGFCSYRLWNIGHLQDIIVFYIPLCLLFFYQFLDIKKTKYLIGIGVCLLLQSLSSWYHMIFIFLLLFIVVLYYYFKERKLSNQDLIKLSGTLITVFILIIPFAFPYFKQNKENHTAFLISDVISGDLGGYLMASPNTFLNNISANYWGISKTRWLENFNYIGYVSLFLSLFCFHKLLRNGSNFKFRSEAILFLIVASVFFIFSLGPYLIFNDRITSIKLPYYYIFQIFSPIRFLRVTARYSTVVFLMTSILASYGLITFIKAIDRKSYRLIIYTLLFILVAVEFTPMERFDRFSDMSKIPEVYLKIKKDPNVKALIELPINVEPFNTTKYIYYAGIHFKPIVNGYSGYEPPSYTFYKNSFDTINEFTSSLLVSIGVTHILCNPDYKKPMNSNFVSLVMKKDGYQLYEIKTKNKASFFMENISPWQKDFQTNDSLLHIKKTYSGVSFNPANEHTLVANISPKKTNEPSTITYTSNRPLKSLYFKFRTYSQTDTLKIECFKQKAGYTDSLLTTNIYTNNSNFLNDFAILNLHGADKIKFILYSSVFPDRTFIKDLILLDHK
jgi:hypothetical protein